MGMKETEMRGQSVNTRARDSDGNWDKKKKKLGVREMFSQVYTDREDRESARIFLKTAFTLTSSCQNTQ